jgi:hypothetical protein
MSSIEKGILAVAAVVGFWACSDETYEEPTSEARLGLTTLNLVAIADTRIKEGLPNGGSATFCNALGDTESLAGTACLMKFAFPLVPNATVTSAWLDVHVLDASPQTYRLRGLLWPFTENEATWVYRQLGVPWHTPGAKNILDWGLFNSPFVVANVGDNNIVFDSLGRAAIELWLGFPSQHEGIILAADLPNSDNIMIASREHATVAYRPTLHIEYYVLPSGDDDGLGGTGGSGGFPGTGGTAGIGGTG